MLVVCGVRRVHDVSDLRPAGRSHRRRSGGRRRLQRGQIPAEVVHSRFLRRRVPIVIGQRERGPLCGGGGGSGGGSAGGQPRLAALVAVLAVSILFELLGRLARAAGAAAGSRRCDDQRAERFLSRRRFVAIVLVAGRSGADNRIFVGTERGVGLQAHGHRITVVDRLRCAVKDK